jgi:hypothetical protein
VTVPVKRPAPAGVIDATAVPVPDAAELVAVLAVTCAGVYVNTGRMLALVEVAGAESRTAVAVAAKGEASEIPVIATVVDTATAVVAADAVAPSVIASAELAACEGATDITPKPNAATVTSAMRLKVVFVDICFLSIVDSRTIPDSAWIVFRPSSR